MWESGPAISDYLSWLIDGRGASHPQADEAAGKRRERMKVGEARNQPNRTGNRCGFGSRSMPATWEYGRANLFRAPRLWGLDG
jgi:hypothetical protein